MRLRRCIETCASAERIWSFLVDPQKIVKWCFPISKLSCTGNQFSGVGTTFYFEEKAVGRLMKLNFVITEWNVNQSIAFRMTSGNLVRGYEQRYTIEATPSGCRFTCSEDVRLPFGIIGRVIGLFRRSVSETLLDNMLVKLKALAETA